jgi:lipopolysaccharide exporter
MKDLGSRSLTAVFWGGGGAALRILLQLVVQVALARILGPVQYGLFAIGAIVISFSNFFSDVGIAYGLIQKAEVNSDDVRYVFTWQLIIGSVVTVAIAGSSHLIALFFGDEDSNGVVFYLSIVCLLSALTAPSNNLLKRNMDFKRIQISQLAGYVVGYIFVGLPLAIYGAKVWALVIAWVVQSVTILIIQYSATKHALRPLIWYKGASSLSGYGATVFITNVTNWFIGNIDKVIVGRVFSGAAIGIYTTTYNLLQNPTSSLLGIVQPVFFSASAKISNDREKIASAYRALIGVVGLCVLPIFFTVAAVADTFVLAVYGESWRDSAEVLRPLAIAMPLFLIWGITTPLLWSFGNPAREFKAQLPIALLWFVVSWFAAKHSLAMVAWSVPVMFAVRCLVIIRVASSVLSLTLTSFWRAIRGGICVTILCIFTACLTDIGLTEIGMKSQFMKLLIEILFCGITYFFAMKNLSGIISEDLVLVIKRIAERCPNFIARTLRALPDLRRHHVI